MVAIIRSWVQANQGSVKINRVRYYLDSTCDPTLENIHGPDCTWAKETPTNSTTESEPTNKPGTATEGSTSASTDKPTKPSAATPGIDPKNPEPQGRTGNNGGGDGTNTGQVAGILLGGVITGLLATLIIILLFYLYWKYRKQS